MTQQNWIQPDQYRECWLFLLIGTDSSAESRTFAAEPLQYWEFATGNPEQLVDIQAEHVENEAVSDKQELVRRLLVALKSHRYEDTTLITPDNRIVRVLRNSLLEHCPDSCTLRGFRHVPLDTELEKHFGTGLSHYSLNADAQRPPTISEQDGTVVHASETPRLFWECFSQLHQLLPPEALRGTHL